MTKTTAAMMADLRKIHIRTERETMLKEALVRLFQEDEAGNLTHKPVRFTDGTETHGITLIEGSGGGKTTAIRKTLKAFEPLRENPETGQPRWLYSKVESPATLRSLGVDMVKKLGIDHVSDRAKVYEIWDLVRRRLSILGITLVWIDEAQDMFKGTQAAETQSMFKMLKGLMQGDHPVVVVLSGTDRLGEITKIDAQVNRRFSKIRPAALEFGAHNEAIETFVRGFAEKAGLETDVSGETINRIIRAGRHRFGRCIELILMAVECALRDGADTLLIEHFELAFGIHEGCEITANIFAVADWAALVLDDDESEAVPAPVKKGVTRARKRG